MSYPTNIIGLTRGIFAGTIGGRTRDGTIGGLTRGIFAGTISGLTRDGTIGGLTRGIFAGIISGLTRDGTTGGLTIGTFAGTIEWVLVGMTNMCTYVHHLPIAVQTSLKTLPSQTSPQSQSNALKSRSA